MDTISIKMKTGFKTDKFGWLLNGQKYDLPIKDALGLISNDRAIELVKAKPTKSAAEVELAGATKQLRKLKATLKKKLAAATSGTKSKDQKEAAEAEVKEKYRESIEKLEATIEVNKKED